MFDEYAKNNKYSSGHRRTDVVFDVCQNNSLKCEVRSGSGKAVRRRVTQTNILVEFSPR